HRQARTTAVRAGAVTDGRDGEGGGDGRRQRGFRRAGRPPRGHDGGAVRARGRPRRRRASRRPLDGAARAAARVTAAAMRVFLHSGGPLGPTGRAGLQEFLGPITRVAFVTAATLFDEAAYFERIRAALAPPAPEGAGLEGLHLRWNDGPLETPERADAVVMGGG